MSETCSMRGEYMKCIENVIRKKKILKEKTTWEICLKMRVL